MKIVLDMTGGDGAPKINFEGAVEALNSFDDVSLVLAGPKDEIEKELQSTYLEQVKPERRQAIEIADAPDLISTEEAPVMALRRKKNSAFGVGMRLVREKEAEAFVSAGSTGAVMAGSMLLIGRIKGIPRPALAALIPVPGRPLLLIDSGANVDCKPEWLLQFALMGSVYMKKVAGLPSPEIGLLNIGVEAEKGNDLSKQTYQLLSQDQPFKFIGNVEARDALNRSCDVLVTDGFAGNVLIKNTEGLATLLFSMLKDSLMSSAKGKAAAFLAKDSFRKIKHSFDSTEIGGAPLLGVEGAVIKAHGNSTGHAIFCAIRQARTMVKSEVVGNIRTGLQELNIHQEENENSGGK